MFAKELAFFIKNQDGLVKQHAGKALVIKGEELCAVYDTPLQAYLQVQRDQQLGTVMIQMCLPGPEAYTATIN
ncbi:MAG: hypothetical protein ACYC92_13610 [Candidatus Acidiferrales bacterium]